ncbi:MAG: SP_1767 family glycosyltransferase [Ruminococcaceae bacterium]|nr:SP_1767 family glycosyltransferase [Oscillospiraceae bacterium]
MKERIKKLLRPIYVPIIERLIPKINKLFHPIHIMSFNETIEYIKKHHCSISRYGDGEFKMMLQSSKIGFQNYSKELKESLLNVLCGKNDNILICIPVCIKTTNGLTVKSAYFWNNYSLNNYNDLFKLICKCGKKRYSFGDSMITRPYMDWHDKESALDRFNNLKSLWGNKDIMIVEGDKTRLGVGNDLFKNTKSIKRILAPAENAYDKYEQIIKSISEHHKDELVLLALGPTATVLAADLTDMGIQALDVGHVDIEYMWCLMNAEEKVPIPNKYTNEARSELHNISICEDKDYLSQIIDRII